MASTPIHRLSVMLAVVLLGPWIAPAAAQRYHTRTYQEADGLPSTTVRSALQDDTGRLWFATRAGVASYDGAEWQHYSRAEGLPATDHGHVIGSPGGPLWAVNTITPIQISRLDGERWTPIPPWTTTPPNQWITTAAVTKHDGAEFILVGTETGQLFVWDGSDWRVVHAADGPEPWRQRAVLAHDGTFLIAATDGLRRFDPSAGGEPVRVDGAPRRETIGIAADRATGRLWIVSADAIGMLANGRFETLFRGQHFELLPEFKGVVARADGRGGLYFGNPAGLFYFDPELGLEHIGRANGLIAEGATSILIDRENNVWVTGLRGITKIISRRFANYNRDQGLFADEVTAALERRNGEVVLGHGGGLTFLRTEPQTLLFEEDDLQGRVMDLAEDPRGTLWVAAAWRGLGALAADGTLTWFGPEDGLNGGVLSVRIDTRGGLWIGTGTGLLKRRDGRFDEVPLPNEPDAMPTHVRRVYEGPSGALYAATKLQGVFRVTPEGVEQATHPTNPEANNVYAVLERGGDETWLGTTVGLVRLANGRIGPLPTAEPRIDRPIYFMVEDDRDRVWFGTDNGVLRWDGVRLKRFTVNEGLIGTETNRAAGLVDKRGRVWIGTDRGVSVYRSSFDPPRPVTPTVELLDAIVEERSLTLTEDHALPHDQNELIYRFRAISFIDEDRVRFRYRLEGLEDEWRGPQEIPTRRIRYTNLSPGAYRLHLEAIDAEGGIGQEAVSAEIRIGRPFWARAWFVMLMLVALVGAIWAAMSHVEQLRYSRRLQREVQVRTEELRRSETRVAADKERLAVTLASISDGVVTVDEAGTIALWNRAAEQITGWSSEEAVGSRLNRVLGVDGEGYAALRIVKDNPSRLAAVTTRARDGSQRLLEVSAAPLGREATPAGHVLAFRDITDRQRVEAELSMARKLEALGLLAGGIAHDFNNLLMVVLGNLSLAEMSEGLSESARDKLQDARAASLKARSLTQQLLTFSKGGAPVRHAASIGDVIRESAKFSLSGSSARCEIDLPDDLWMVEIDEGQMSQVLHNLLINARQAMPRGGTVRIRGSNIEAPPTPLPGGPYVIIEVEDDGVGIAEDSIGRVFDPYFSTKEDGSGLGLATAYSVVSRHDGLLTVESVAGQGAVFKIHLPAARKTAPSGRAPSVETAETSGRVLLMDDDENVRCVVLEILEHYGFAVAGAADGQEAITLYCDAMEQGCPFDVVIMDLTIPGGMNGKEAVQRLREIDPNLRAVAASGYHNDPVMAHYRENGFSDALGKPFEISELLRVLSTVLAEARQPAERGQ